MDLPRISATFGATGNASPVYYFKMFLLFENGFHWAACHRPAAH